MARASYNMHRQAREEAVTAFETVYNREPSQCERLYLMAVALLETTYGYGWKDAGVGSNNMGAITTRSTDPAKSFEYGDKDESGKPIRVRFAKYPSRHDGWVDLVKTLYVRRPAVYAAAKECDFMRAAAMQRRTGYYVAPLAIYQKGIDSGIKEITSMLGEDIPRPKAG